MKGSYLYFSCQYVCYWNQVINLGYVLQTWVVLIFIGTHVIFLLPKNSILAWFPSVYVTSQNSLLGCTVYSNSLSGKLKRRRFCQLIKTTMWRKRQRNYIFFVWGRTILCWPHPFSLSYSYSFLSFYFSEMWCLRKCKAGKLVCPFLIEHFLCIIVFPMYCGLWGSSTYLCFLFNFSFVLCFTLVPITICTLSARRPPYITIFKGSISVANRLICLFLPSSSLPYSFLCRSLSLFVSMSRDTRTHVRSLSLVLSQSTINRCKQTTTDE